MATQTFKNEQTGFDPESVSPQPEDLVLRAIRPESWVIGRVYEAAIEGDWGTFPKGSSIPASDLELARFDDRHRDGMRLEDPEYFDGLRTWHAERGFLDPASWEANQPNDGHFIGPAHWKADHVDARGFYTSEMHYITGLPWDQSLRDAYGNPVCPVAPFAHRFVESAYDYNQGRGAFSIPVITRYVGGRVWPVTWVPTFFGMVRHEGWARDEDFLKEMFFLEVVDESDADTEAVRRKARAGIQYTDAVGGCVIGVVFERDGAYYLVQPDDAPVLLESHMMNPMRRMFSSVRLHARLQDETNGECLGYEALFRTLGLADEEVAA